ncbi:MFS transporter [Natrinema gelatinilyticum]|uniref:MFS transporter n=1 Tax=Natrinema gelatinilyticum TaxID=2961571 RepID=UPI0020C25D86|nr:MFS transporter [Natrinema gelatinilyticum]
MAEHTDDEHTLAGHKEATNLPFNVEEYTDMLAGLESDLGRTNRRPNDVSVERSALQRRIGLEPTRFDCNASLTKISPIEAADRHRYRSEQLSATWRTAGREDTFLNVAAKSDDESMIQSLFGEKALVLRDTNFQLLLLANLVAPLGAALISPLLDSLQQPYGASDATIGLIMTVFTAPGILMIPAVGVLADRYGRKPFLVGGLFVFSVAGTALAATTDFRLVLFLRFCQGVSFAAVTPVIITSIGDLYTGQAEAMGQGFRFSVSGLTQGVFPLVGGVLVATAWQYPLLLYAIGIPISIVLALAFSEPTDVSRERSTNPTSTDRGTYVRELLALLRRPRVASVLVFRMTPILLYITFMTYVSLLVVRSMGGTPGQAGMLVALTSLTYAISATQAGRFGSSFAGRIAPLAASQLLMAIGLVVVAFVPTVTLAAPGAVALGIGFGLSLSLLRSVVTGFAPTQLRGGLVSIFESSGRLSATVAPIAVGVGIELLDGAVTQTESLQLMVGGMGIFGGVVGVSSLLIARTASALPQFEATGSD